MDIKILASGSSGNCYWVSDGNTQILLDCGIPAKKIREKLDFRLSDVDACLVTHEHGDHCKAVNELVNKYGIKVYMSLGTARGMVEKSWLDTLLILRAQAKVPFMIKTMHIYPFDTQHDANEPLGFLIKSDATGESLLYFTDTYYLKYRFKGINYMLVECNYVGETLRDNIESGYIDASMGYRVMRSHMSLEHLLIFLESCDLSDLRQIYLVHMSKNNGDPDKMLAEVKALTGAEAYIA